MTCPAAASTRNRPTTKGPSPCPNAITKFVAVISLPDGSGVVMLARRNGEMNHQPYLKRKADMTNMFCDVNPYSNTKETAIITIPAAKGMIRPSRVLCHVVALGEGAGE